MFDGALVSVPDMPWSYLPTLFALQLPEVLLGLSIAGVVGTLVALPRRDVSARRKTILLMLTLAATLPLADCDGEAPGALQRHPAFHLRHPADDGARGHRLRLGNELAQGKSPQLATGRARRFRVRPAVAARRNDPAASLSIHPLQPYRRHGARRRRPLHAGLLGPRLQAGFRRPARAARRTAGSRRRTGANGRSRYAVRNARRRSRSVPISRSAGTATPPTSR